MSLAGKVAHPFCIDIDFARASGLLRRVIQAQKPKDTPYELLALLLTLPVELIYQKLVLLLVLGDRNHQL